MASRMAERDPESPDYWFSFLSVDGTRVDPLNNPDEPCFCFESCLGHSPTLVILPSGTRGANSPCEKCASKFCTPVHRATANETVRIEPESDELDANEPASIVIELMDQLGDRPLKGSVFEDPEIAQDAVDLDQQRNMQIQYLRVLAAQHQEESQTQPAEAVPAPATEEPRPRTVHPWDADWTWVDDQGPLAQQGVVPSSGPYASPTPVDMRHHHVTWPPRDAVAVLPQIQDEVLPPPPTCGAAHASVATLREAAIGLERIANMLEQHDLYDSADQTRGLAEQMRLEARAAKSGVSTQAQPKGLDHEALKQPARDSQSPYAPGPGKQQLDLEALNQDVRQLREQLRQARAILEHREASPAPGAE
jgi:hypothetical protein